MQRGVRFFEQNDSHAARGWLLEHLVAPVAGQERSHAAWRSFF